MRIFLLTKAGVARVFRTYAFGPGNRVITSDPRDAGIEEIIPAPDAADLIAKWHPRHQAEVTNIREIAEADIPDAEFKDAWRDSGASIDVDMPAARELHAGRIAHARGIEIARLATDEAQARLAGRVADATQHASDRAALEALDLPGEGLRIANAPNPQALSAVWPAGLARP